MVQEAGEERTGSGCPEVAGTGKIEEKLEHRVPLGITNNTKRCEQLRKRWESGSN